MPPPVRRRGAADERGAFSVMYALMLVMLLSIAALGMDIGNAVSRKTDTQNQADFAAYDVGQKFALDIASGSGPLAASNPIVQDVADSLNHNQPQDDEKVCWRDENCVTATQLTDGDLSNGEVRYTAHGLQVVAPLAKVNFGFANVFGASGTSVQSAATVNVFSAGPRVFPMFAVADCSWGRETLTDPAHTPAPSGPSLYYPENGPADLHEVTLYDSTWTEEPTVPLNASGHHLSLSANDWEQTYKVGFFHEDGSPPREVTGADLKSAADHVTAWPTPADGAGPVEMAVPDMVSQKEGLWYMRAWGGKNSPTHAQNKWSADAIPFRVGDEVLENVECPTEHIDGNFGTIKVPRTDTTPGSYIAKNIAKGLQDGINLVVHKQHNATGLCDDLSVPGNVGGGAATDGANEATTVPDADVNCVDTDTGLPANAATEGLVQWDGGNGLLIKPTADGCDPDGGSAERRIDINGGPYYINDDTLSCFLLPGKTLAQVTQPTYSGGQAFTKDLFKSPRFAWVPVFDVQPDSGGSKRYSIVDFRPAFITDEVVGGDATANNGLTVQGNDIKKIQVVFFSGDALPRDTDQVIDYLGVGDPIVHLID